MGAETTASGSDFVTFVGIALGLLTLAIVPVSELLLSFYRRAVVRSMHGGTAAAVGPAPAALPVVSPTGAVEWTVLSAVETASGVGALTCDLHTRIVDAIRRTALVYALAGLAYSGVMGAAMMVQAGTAGVVAWLCLSGGFAWPAILTGLTITELRLRTKAAIVTAYLAGVWIPLLAIDALFDSAINILLVNTSATLIAAIMRANRVRAVAPLVAAFATIQLLAIVAALQLFMAYSARNPDEQTASGGEALLTIAGAAVLAAAGAVLGWLLLRLVGRLYERKQGSDQTVMMFATWFLFAGVQSVAFAYADGVWMLAGLVAFIVFVAVSTIGVRVLVHAPREGPRLLVLRVFKLGRRSRRLFDAIARRWRHAGSVQLISGPDVARSTVEPHEFLDFLRRRLSRRFIDTEEAAAAALAGVDTTPDYDGRFRVTDFFCRDHSWRLVLNGLAHRADVVLMDLRGFTTANAGCAYELGELLNTVPLARVIVVVDRRTDEAFVSQILDTAWAHMPSTSPNRTIGSAQLRVFRETGWWGVDHATLLRLLCRSVTVPERVAV